MWNWIVPILCFLYLGSNYSRADENLRATLKSLAVTSDIKFRYATTRVSALYTNPYNSPVTADFHVTLPAQAYISNFSMTIDDNVTYGVIKKKEEAKSIYESAISRGQSTGYIEVKHRFTNVYDISVNVEPQKEVLFNLTYQELLQRSLGKYRHVIHLINKEIINDFLIEVFITEPQDIIGIQIPKITSDDLESTKENVDAELEDVTVEYFDAKNVYIRYNPSPEEQQKFGDDGIEGLFKVNYDVDRQDNPNMIYAVDGYFVHFFAPDSLPALQKNIVFMLDTSGSMDARKLGQLKEAMITILKSLKPDLDNFLIGSFSRDVRWMNDGFFMKATENNTADAINEIKKLTAIGGTNINMALLKSVRKLNSLESGERKNVLFFLTDGQATVGVLDTKEIRKNVKEANNDSISFFMLGFGNRANINFLKEVATENGGFGRKIYLAADSQLQIEGLYTEISNILLKDIQISYLDTEVDLDTLSPTNFSSFFKGSEIVTTGKLDLDEQKELNVQMSMINLYGSKTMNLKLELLYIPMDEHPNNPNLITLNSLSEITRNTWVYLTLKKLLKEETSEENSEKIISLALRYGFVTPLTAMVVTKENLVGRVQNEDEIDLDGARSLSSRPNAFSHSYKLASVVNHPLMPMGGVLPKSAGMRNSNGLQGQMHTFRQRSRGISQPTLRPLINKSFERLYRVTTTSRPFYTTNAIQPKDFIPGIILEPYGCNETLCLGSHRSCLTHSRVLLLADSHAYIYIYGYMMKTSSPNCMEALTKIVIKKKRKVLALITPELMKKNQKTYDLLTNKTNVVLTVKKYLRLKVYIKTVNNQKALTVHFTVLQPLPSPKGILEMYMTNVTCPRKGPTHISLANKPELYRKIKYNSTQSDQKECYINV